MLEKIYKFRLKADSNTFTLLFILVILSLVLGIYNNYQITNGGGVVQNVGTDGTKYEPLKNLVKNVSKNADKIGNPKAKVTVVEFEDFQCPFCKRFHDETWETLKKEYIDTNKILFIHQDLAFLGPESEIAAQASHCASDQGKFWEFRDYLYGKQGGENSGVMSKENLKKYAKEMGLNSTEFDGCLDLGKYKDLVADTKEFAGKYGISGTPTFIINDQKISGALPIESFRAAIDSILK